MTSSLSQQAREKLAQEYQAEREARNPQLTPSRTFCNAAQPPNSYVPGAWNVRAGAGEKSPNGRCA
jgi:hypothetical protein